MEIKDNKNVSNKTKRIKKEQKLNKKIEQHEKHEIWKNKNAMLTYVENIDKVLLDNTFSPKKRSRLENKKAKLLSSDKGLSNKQHNRKLKIIIFTIVFSIGIIGFCLSYFL